MALRRSFSDAKKATIKSKFNGHCAYCGDKPEKLFLDHIVPISRGGTNHQENLFPACFSCDCHKRDFSVEEFRAEIKSLIERGRRCSFQLSMAIRFGLVTIIDKPIVFYYELVREEEKCELLRSSISAP